MKQILLILILLTTYSCSSIKFDYDYLNYSSSEIDKKFNESQRNNWHNLDLNYDSIPGMSVERAYNELLKGRKANKVIVAVIDAGIDINHEDIKDVIWVNKDEIPNNNIDDDGNGFIDDTNGWNFLGESYNETLEMTRLIRDNLNENRRYDSAKKTIKSKFIIHKHHILSSYIYFNVQKKSFYLKKKLIVYFFRCISYLFILNFNNSLKNLAKLCAVISYINDK